MTPEEPTPPTRGTTVQFDRLHALVVTTFVRELERCEAAGEPPSPAFLAAATKFLSANDVNVPERVKTLRDELAKSMPDFDVLEGARSDVVPFRRPLP